MSAWQSEVIPGLPAADARFLVHSRQSFLQFGGSVLLDRQAFVSFGGKPDATIGLGYLASTPIYLWQAAEASEVPDAPWLSLRHLLTTEGHAQAAMLRYASQIGTWQAQNRFCGSCGAPLTRHPSERAMVCATCELHQYPRLSPCMITLVTDGDWLLLARSLRHPPGMYSTLAGFVEPGETVEQCIEREVLEEVGLRVCDIRYVASQNWPFPHALMLGFRASYAGGQIVPQPGEIEDARWFRYDQLPQLPSTISIARYLIDSFIAERLGEPLPERPA